MFASLTDAGIRIGFQRNTPPFSYSPTAGFRPIGYSVDLADLVLARIHGGADRVPPVEAVEVTSTTREGLLAAGRIDLECGSTTITEERRRRFAFSRPIFRTSHRIALKGDPGPRDLRVVGIRDSTSQAALEAEPDPGFGYSFTGVPSIGAARDAFLADDGIDAMVADEVILRSLLAGEARADVRMLDLRLGGEDYGFLLRKEDGKLLRAVDEALSDIFGSPGYRALIDTWFAGELPGLGFSLEMDPDDRSFVSEI
ncbi:transporter substrate-binding domain-containing protein [Kitasatospora sp. NPDC057198]|uniref:transporter substrate-binding domain-containing protein n=1 Tax=Kitasatospora sp. NPDC057198 TaxID=3346046 RepID=UPI003634C3B3